MSNDKRKSAPHLSQKAATTTIHPPLTFRPPPSWSVPFQLGLSQLSVPQVIHLPAIFYMAGPVIASSLLLSVPCCAPCCFTFWDAWLITAKPEIISSLDDWLWAHTVKLPCPFRCCSSYWVDWSLTLPDRWIYFLLLPPRRLRYWRDHLHWNQRDCHCCCPLHFPLELVEGIWACWQDIHFGNGFDALHCFAARLWCFDLRNRLRNRSWSCW